MTNLMTSDTSFWLKFLNDSDLAVGDSAILQYSMLLADRFATVEEFSAVNESELLQLGITNQTDRTCLMKQVRLLNDKENHLLPINRQSIASNHITGSWLPDNQSTPLNPKSKCNLSPALLSRISFNDHPTSIVSPSNEFKKCNFEQMIETPERHMAIDHNAKIQTLIESCQKKTPPTSAHGMRPLKSLSDTISLQKKIIVGTDRLKRLALTRSLFKRHTALITKKVTNIKNKFMNPFEKIKTKIDPTSSDNIIITPRRTVISRPMKQTRENDEKEPKERRKVQALSLNNDLRRSTDLIFRQEEEEEGLKRIVQPIQTLTNKRFKLGATTSFLTRSLAHHSHIE